jgi:hypothetical protein
MAVSHPVLSRREIGSAADTNTTTGLGSCLLEGRFPILLNLNMLRRQARGRRAYLHQKALAAKSNISHLRKLKAHIDKDKELPKELQDPSLRKDLRYDEAQLMIDEADQMDDEYSNLGVREPRILITTSRDPLSR